MAQYAGGGGMGGGGQAPAPQPRTPDIAPPALPGANTLAPVATGPVVQKPAQGDPTAALFAAIVKGDDGAAQTAVGRGANLNAQNQFGETPLDLAIALNRTGITFLLLQTRNELAAQTGGPEPMGAPWTLNSPSPATQKAATPVMAPQPRVSLPTDGGTPNPNAGFLGFGPKN
jgi:ankyrin repeat protein